MIRLTGSATGCTATAHPRGTRSIPAATDHEHCPWSDRAAVEESDIVAVDGPCPPGFGPFIVSSGFYHRIAFALPFGLASTHAGVWQCRPAVTLSGRLTSGARFHASAVPSFSGPLHQPGAGTPAGTDEMFVILHLPSHGASWRSHDYYGSSATPRRQQRTVRLPRTHQPGSAGTAGTLPAFTHMPVGRVGVQLYPGGIAARYRNTARGLARPNSHRSDETVPKSHEDRAPQAAHSRQFRGC